MRGMHEVCYRIANDANYLAFKYESTRLPGDDTSLCTRSRRLFYLSAAQADLTEAALCV
jgi:hypothetical protein